MANINQVSPDGGTTIYDLEDTTARNGINAITDGQSIESFSDVETALATKANISDLGTAATKNSTSVVIQSTDLVESGAVKDIVGWGNKNLLPTWLFTDTEYFTINADGSITALKSDTRPYTNVPKSFLLKKGTYFYGKDNSSRMLVYDVDNSQTLVDTSSESATFTLDADTNVKVKISASGTFPQTIKAIICDNNLTDKSWTPYHVSVEETLRDAEVVEGKNLLPNNKGNSTNTGVSWTVNSDLSVTANRVSSASDNSTYPLPITIKKSGKYITSGCPANGSSSTYRAAVFINSILSGYDEGDGYEFEANANDVVTYRSTVYSSYSANNLVFKPMLRKATESDPTYEPYYIPLKDVVPTKADNSVIAPIENGTNASQAWSVGQHFMNGGVLKEVTQPISSGGAISDSNTVNRQIADCLVKRATFSSTTGNTGIITLSIPDGAHILAVEIENVIGIIYRRLSQPYLGIKCLNPADMAVLTETAVSGTYYYID